MIAQTVGDVVRGPVANDFRTLASLARRNKPLPMGSVEGMAECLRIVEKKRSRKQRVRVDDVRAGLLYAADYMALLGLHLPVRQAVFLHDLDKAFEVATRVEVRP